ncbi:MAG: ATP-dependent helicase HrpB [Salinivirgaceae bacterium]|nr:ATP-dependent helicase HrpB [Salinivirgaceae bacterium]
MSFDPFKIDLPITKSINEVKQQLATNNTLIVHAPPGAGKSTLLPLALMDEVWLNGKKIIMLEPRRLATKTIAIRQAELLNEKLGERIGYRIRFESKIGTNTQIEVVTEGILTRMLQNNNGLEGVGLVIFDEFHERSLHADVALALCRESQQILRNDLRILIMSATLDMPQLTSILNANSVVSEGRQYPVEIKYTDSQDFMMLPELTAKVISKALKEEQGDILAFLPGEREIKNCETILKMQGHEAIVYPLYGQLPPSKQFAAIMPHKDGKRKVVLATSIAETSLTIEGIKIVIDSGYSRNMSYNPGTGLSKLETHELTLDTADQRAGRAGRLGPGVCYRMWSKATQNRLVKHRRPEILEADLTSLVLEMAIWGNSDINSLTWLTPPPQVAVEEATELLEQLEAIEDGVITAQGREIHKLPCHPRIAHMLVMAQQEGLAALACDVAAILEERDPLDKTAGIDINLRIEALRRFRDGAIKNKNLGIIEKVSQQYRKLLNIKAENSIVDPYETGLILVYAYPDRIAHSRPGNNAQFMLANGNIATVGHKDDLAHEAWLAVGHVIARDAVSKIFLASPLNPTDLTPLVKDKTVIEWNTRQGGFIATQNKCIGNIILQSKPIEEVNEEQKIDAITKAIAKEGKQLLNFDRAVEDWQNRVLSIKIWRPNEGWPDVSTHILLAQNKKWLAPYLTGIKKPEDLKKIDLKEVLIHQLDYDKQQLLNKLAPERIAVPSGSKIKLLYSKNGDTPILAVRLQEVFGLQQTPTINEGKTKVIMHLLSPGYKPVQVTSDLPSFWQTLYFEVKSELQRKYPKHEWPSDPMKAKPIRGVQKNKNK